MKLSEQILSKLPKRKLSEDLQKDLEDLQAAIKTWDDGDDEDEVEDAMSDMYVAMDDIIMAMVASLKRSKKLAPLAKILKKAQQDLNKASFKL